MSADELSIIALSLQVAALSTLASLPFAALMAWVLARWDSPWRSLLHGVVMLPMVMPPVVTGFLLLTLLGRSSLFGSWLFDVFGVSIAYSTLACVIAAGVVGFPLMVESMRLALLGVDPRLERISRSLGRGRWATAWRVTLPLAWPGVIGGAVFAFARALGEYGATIVLAGNVEGETETISLRVMEAISSFRAEEEGVAIRLVCVSVAISLVALLLATWLQRAQRAKLLDVNQAGARDV